VARLNVVLFYTSSPLKGKEEALSPRIISGAGSPYQPIAMLQKAVFDNPDVVIRLYVERFVCWILRVNGFSCRCQG
jgi:hypothetical protein